MFPYIVKQLYEAYKRYEQLQMMINQGRDGMDYLRFINSGLNDLSGLLSTLPIKDEKLLEELKSFQKATGKVIELYGMIPKSEEAAMQLLHDQTIAESFKMTNSAKEYADTQEANANQAFRMSGQMSPKGAVRLQAATNAQILHTMSQLLKVNGQLLKLQSEQFGVTNKREKDSVSHFNRINSDVKASLASFKGEMALPRF
jgi:hypothetical protein